MERAGQWPFFPLKALWLDIRGYLGLMDGLGIVPVATKLADVPWENVCALDEENISW